MTAMLRCSVRRIRYLRANVSQAGTAFYDATAIVATFEASPSP
jgi:hypothetical protein